MTNMIPDILMTLRTPLKITDYSVDAQVHYYYSYHKERNSKARFLRVIVKYLNGHGFVITAYFVERMK